MSLLRKLAFSKLLVLAMLLAHAANTDKYEILKQANTQYAEGFYDHALELYLQVAGGGYASSELYYNIGNIYFKLARFPQAILYYERALKLSPADENIIFNLQLANNRITDKIETLPGLFYMRWWKSVLFIIPANGWAVMSIVLLCITLVFAAVYLISKLLWVRKIAFYMALTVFVFTCLALVMAYSAHKELTNRRDAIIFEASVVIKSAPTDKSTDLFLLHEGTKVRITDEVGEWREVRIASGSAGWLKIEALEII